MKCIILFHKTLFVNCSKLKSKQNNWNYLSYSLLIKRLFLPKVSFKTPCNSCFADKSIMSMNGVSLHCCSCATSKVHRQGDNNLLHLKYADSLHSIEWSVPTSHPTPSLWVALQTPIPGCGGPYQSPQTLQAAGPRPPSQCRHCGSESWKVADRNMSDGCATSRRPAQTAVGAVGDGGGLPEWCWEREGGHWMTLWGLCVDGGGG